MPRKWYFFWEEVGKAARGILYEYLRDTLEDNVIYFDGWEGLGASVTLKTVSQLLASAEEMSPELKFDKIIHIDCSMWKNRRAVQKQIAEKVNVPDSIMAIFDKQDEDDDFHGVDEHSRFEIIDVSQIIHQILSKSRIVVIFHNGSDQEIDIARCGIPLDGIFTNKVLWTYRGRFRIKPSLRERVQKANVLIRSPFKWWTVSKLKDIWYAEVKEIAQYTHKYDISPTIVVECLLYMLILHKRTGYLTDYNWEFQASNYWICDGIIKGVKEESQAWEVGDALCQEMRLDLDCLPREFLQTCWFVGDEYLGKSHHDRWISTTSKDLKVHTISSKTSSFFLASEESRPPLELLHNNKNIFQHCNNLGVLKLCRCTFRFASPPFLKCHSLRFLGLDHCDDLGGIDGGEMEEQSHSQPWACFQSLWVLDLHYIDWDQILLSQEIMKLMTNLREFHVEGAKCWNMSHVWGRLYNLRKLRVIGPTNNGPSAVIDYQMKSIELLDLSGNSTMQVLPNLFGSTSLKTLILDGCFGLEHVVLDSPLLPSLESFKLNVDLEGIAKIYKISLRGCPQLKNLFLGGLMPNFKELDLSGTILKIVDLSTVRGSQLKQLILLGCVQLRAILWPKDIKPHNLDVLQIDTTTSRGEKAAKKSVLDGYQQPYPWFQLPEGKFQWHIAITDARFLWSLERSWWHHPREKQFVHAEVSSTAIDCSSNSEEVWRQLDQPVVANEYNHVFDKVASNANDTGVMWDCPQPTHSSSVSENKYVKIMTRELQGSDILVHFLDEIATSLHVHDCDTSIISIPGLYLNRIIWYRVERCPMLHSVFTHKDEDNDGWTIFYKLEIFWASHLLRAHYIWSVVSKVDTKSFENLRYIHVEYCRRLIHVLPLSFFTLPRLEKLHILCCYHLRQVFPIHPAYRPVKFPRLKHIHLHDLPMLQQICGFKMSTPELKTFKIRGCWSLCHLPAISPPSYYKEKKKPIVDCEKDWWDNLKWNGMEANHHPSLYEHRHSPYYKKTLPRGSLLR